MKIKIVFIILMITSSLSCLSQQYVVNPKYLRAEFTQSLILERIKIQSDSTYFYFKFKLADYAYLKTCLSDVIFMQDAWQNKSRVKKVIGFPNIKQDNIEKRDSIVQFHLIFGHISDTANIIDLYSINESGFYFHSIDISKRVDNYTPLQQNVNPTNQNVNISVPNNPELYDLIFMRDGNEIKAKIIDVGISEIKYKKIDNIDGPNFTCLKADVLMIKYSNGTKDIFKETLENTIDYCSTGEMDASKNFHYSGAGTFFLTALVSPLIGVIATAAISSNEPYGKALNAPNPDLLKNPAYKDCYVHEAHRIKKRKAWTGFWIGFVVDVVAYAILLNAQ